MVIFRRIDPDADREFLVDLRVQTLFQNETPWGRSPGLPGYRRWFLSSRQPQQFLKLLTRSLRDPRTLAEIVEVDGARAGFLWATYVEVRESDFRYLELHELSFRPEFQRQGLGRLTQSHLEEFAAQHDIDAVRSFAGTLNEGSIAFHESQGYRAMEIRFEKLLKPRGVEDDV